MLGLQDLVSSILSKVASDLYQMLSEGYFLKVAKVDTTRETQMGGVVVPRRSGQLEIGASLPRSCSVWRPHLHR